MSQEWHAMTQWGGDTFGLVASARGLRRVVLPHQWTHDSRNNLAPDTVRLRAWIHAFDDYWTGRLGAWPSKLDMVGTPFQVLVWHALMEIPYGTLVTYAEVAQRIDRPRAVRAVASAIAQNPLPIVVPCHRVVGSNGSLTGYRGGLHLKSRLLALEGVQGVNPRGHARFMF